MSRSLDPDLGLNCLPSLSADGTGRQSKITIEMAVQDDVMILSDQLNLKITGKP